MKVLPHECRIFYVTHLIDERLFLPDYSIVLPEKGDLFQNQTGSIFIVDEVYIQGFKENSQLSFFESAFRVHLRKQ